MEADALDLESAKDEAVPVFLFWTSKRDEHTGGAEDLILRKLESQRFSRLGCFAFHKAYFDRWKNERWAH
jgi:hypothetical protein